MKRSNEGGCPGTTVQSTGPWPFVTRHGVWRNGRAYLVRRSRNHRKGLIEQELREAMHSGRALLRSLWTPSHLNWWIGVVFALGAALFITGCVLVLVPSIAREWSLGGNTVNAVFFAGSIPFSTAAYLQLFQAANADGFVAHEVPTARSIRIFGWRPGEIGWLSCALQFAGTLLFNFNTFDAMIPGLNWFQQDLVVWIPNLIGSVLFLLSGYLAFIETCHAHWAWKPGSLSWWITFINLLGCVAFMASALFAFVPTDPHGFDGALTATAFTLIGGVCFLVGSLLLLPETGLAGSNQTQR